MNECPLGFVGRDGQCVVVANPFISLMMQTIQDQVVDSASGIVFSTGTGTDFYPSDVGTNNPIPATQRGYYFNSDSFMVSRAFYLSYNFTIVLHVFRLGC